MKLSAKHHRRIGQLYEKEKFDQLLEYLRNLPELAFTTYAQGLCYFCLADFAKSEKYFKRALSMDDRLTVARVRLCESLIKQGRVQDAQEEFDGISQFPTEFDRLAIDFELAIAREDSRASGLARELASVPQSTPYQLETAGVALIRTDQFELLEQLINEHPNPEFERNIGYRMANHCLDREDIEGARRLIDHAGPPGDQRYRLYTYALLLYRERKEECLNISARLFRRWPYDEESAAIYVDSLILFGQDRLARQVCQSYVNANGASELVHRRMRFLGSQ